MESYDVFIKPGFDYGVNSFPRKFFDLTAFYKSSLFNFNSGLDN